MDTKFLNLLCDFNLKYLIVSCEKYPCNLDGWVGKSFPCNFNAFEIDIFHSFFYRNCEDGGS